MDKHRETVWPGVRVRKFAVIMLLASLALAGCAHYPVNARLERFGVRAGYRFGNLAAWENNSDEVFVVLALSGGGSRAAAFSYGVLEELEKTKIKVAGRERTLLDEIDVISSVSGSSVTAAY